MRNLQLDTGNDHSDIALPAELIRGEVKNKSGGVAVKEVASGISAQFKEVTELQEPKEGWQLAQFFLSEMMEKVENEEALLLNELKFLYEIDGPIEGRGIFQTVVLVNQIKKGRNLKADYAKIYGVSEDQVTDDLRELNRNTKVYIGNEVLAIEQNLTPDQLQELSQIIGIKADLTALSEDAKQVLLEWQGTLIDGGSQNIDYPALKTLLHDFKAPRARGKIRLISLEQAGSIEANYATDLDIPQLKRTNDISADRVRHFSAPSLQDVEEDIFVGGATSFDAPSLKRVGRGIFDRSATSFHIPALKSVGSRLHWGKGNTYVPSSEIIGYGIDAESVEEFNAPELQFVGCDLTVSNAQTISTPKLKKIARDCDARNAKNFFAPHVQVGGKLRRAA